MNIKFESELPYQRDAIHAVVDIFQGQEVCASNFTVYSPAFLAKQNTLELNQIGYANKLQLTDAQVLENVQKIQLRNGLKPSKVDDVLSKHYDFSTEMETGTGKTYVYLRSIMEMNRMYGFTKFIIVVPSIPIKEGVYKSLQITEAHFKGLYNNINYKYFIYDSSRLNEIRDFAVNDMLQIMVINIDAFSKSFENEKDESKNVNIIHRYNDKLGYKPLSLIQDTKPVVIIDEPQTTLSTETRKKSVKNLHPLVMLRYSATHKEKLNLMYKLDAVDAYNQQLVKQIEVASVKTDGTTNSAYVKLLSVSNKNGITATVEIDVMEKGERRRKTKDVKKLNDLLQICKLQDYEGFQVRDIYTKPGNEYIEFNNDVIIKLGNAHGNVDEKLVRRMMISKTIEEHLNKELLLNPIGIKVLSLFFIDAVKHYRTYDEDGNAQNGDYATIFEEEYRKLIKKPKYQTLFDGIKDMDSEVSEIHNGYFSIDKKAKASNKKEKFEYYKDTSGTVAADEDTYNLIMKDKEKLLSFESKLRFLFSHSALKEGWDNPNVFQICTLKEAGASEIRRRQEIGRGLRLAVNQQGERVRGFDVNTLTVMASESYEDFVDNLQKEMEKETGITFGVIQEYSFNNITLRMDGNEPVFYGQEASVKLFEYLLLKGYINAHGKVSDILKEDLRTGNVALPYGMEEHVKNQVIETLKQTAGKLEIKRNEDKQQIKVNKQVLLSPDFKQLWDRIKYKTTYSVKFDSTRLIEACTKEISARIQLNRGKLIYEKVSVQVTKGGLMLSEPDIDFGRIMQEVDVLPDIVSYLQNETQLTRKSIVEILKGCTNLKCFKVNPQKFIEGCIEIINEQMRLFIVDGIVYSKIGDHEFYSQELFEEKELIGYLKTNMISSTKSPFEHVVFDSVTVESELVKQFEKQNEIKVYAKLPSWFIIDTPLGTYNPDWAVLIELEGVEKLYFVVESKGTLGKEFLRPSEQGKIDCGKKHFEELSKSSGLDISLEHIRNYDDLINVVMGKG